MDDRWSAASAARRSRGDFNARVTRVRIRRISIRASGNACVEALRSKMVGRNRRPRVSWPVRIIYPYCMVDSYRDRLRKVLRGYVELSVGR